MPRVRGTPPDCELVGTEVVLKRDLRNYRRDEFRKGERMLVLGARSGRFVLCRPDSKMTVVSGARRGVDFMVPDEEAHEKG